MRIEQEREHRCASGSVTFGDSYERFVLWWIEWFGRHDSFRGYESILLQLVGSIDISVSGGMNPYTFSWNEGPTTEDRTNIAAGSYTVTVTDARGCTASKS